LVFVASLYGRGDASSAYGKYVGLKQVIECRHDRAVYGRYQDYGYRQRDVRCRQMGKGGYWVYDYPRWYIWRDVRVSHYEERPYHDSPSVEIGVHYNGTTPPNRHIHNNRYDNGRNYHATPPRHHDNPRHETRPVHDSNRHDGNRPNSTNSTNSTNRNDGNRHDTNRPNNDGNRHDGNRNDTNRPNRHNNDENRPNRNNLHN